MDGMSLEESLSGVDSSLFRLFRQKTSDLQYSKLEKDQYVARWLKARSWDVEKAEKMFRMHLQWRNEVKQLVSVFTLTNVNLTSGRILEVLYPSCFYHHQLDELLATFKMPEVVEKYFPGGICGQDKFGRPTFICPAGTADVFGLMRSASRTQLALSRYYVMEKIVEEILPAQSQKMGRPIDQLVIIFDLQHMNRRQLWRPWLNFVLEMTSIFEVNFPELMAVCFVLNAPSFFSMIFSLLKPILSKETQDKIHILGSNYFDELLKLFNPEDLPAHYGGTMCDPDGDPKCSSRICWGGTVPESYYQIQQSSPASSMEVADDAFLLVPVGRGSKEYFYVGEAKSGDTVSWEFYTESNDIAFSLWVEPQSDSGSLVDEGSRRRLGRARGPNSVGSSGMTTSFSFNNLLGSQGSGGKLDLRQITRSLRVDCDLVPELGNRQVDLDGNYYLLFDNSYSWTRAKRIWCKAEVVCSNPLIKDGNSNNNSVADGEMEGGDLKAVDVELSEVMKTVCAPDYSSLSTLDVDVSALVIILLRTVPIIRRRFRSSQSSSSSPQGVKFKRPIKTTV
ncbi:SEC14-like protein [Echinococcus granulosus]|uniref:SEC14-like protein n=1 Tax=Echinococcus granulosus TaxID=6210 RepID=W6U7T6_ECHGR|nr:SEC14-like protein [Echinococcus granulosus]EUB57245.1 SEC14-like protein [Echinococcus granulosus]